MADNQTTGTVAKSQAAAKRKAAVDAKRVRILVTDAAEFTWNKTDMHIKHNQGEVFAVVDMPNRPKIRRVDRSISSNFADELVKEGKAEYIK